jgi:hypothetical protein
MLDLELEHFPNSGDSGDMASISSDNDLKLAMYRHKIDNHNDELPSNGFCNYCGTSVESGKFCPAEENGSCATDYQREQEAKMRNGRR